MTSTLRSRKHCSPISKAHAKFNPEEDIFLDLILYVPYYFLAVFEAIAYLKVDL